MTALRRYEIFLPRRFNDGSEVPDEVIIDAVLELRRRFGAVSGDTQTVQGYWAYQGFRVSRRIGAAFRPSGTDGGEPSVFRGVEGAAESPIPELAPTLLAPTLNPNPTHNPLPS